jgi:hypothetical protein
LAPDAENAAPPGAGRVALVFCVHHKPWLMMSTLITALAQDYQDADFFFLYNVGSGDRRYGDAVAINPQLSAFDARVRDVCRLTGRRTIELEYENDEALDSGAWYKFIRDGHWKAYDWVLFVGEGTLFARPNLLSAMLEFARTRGAHVIASGHEKRRLPKDRFLRYHEYRQQPSEVERLHDRMIGKAFEIFCRDAAFRRLFDQWRSDFPPQTENHVPAAGPPSPWVRRLRWKWAQQFGAPSAGGLVRQLPWLIEYVVARAGFARTGASGSTAERVHVNGVPRPADAVADVTRVGGAGFHRVAGPEWFGCATNHLMSRQFLERFSAKLDEFRMWEVLDLRFAGTALEVIWGFIPAWLGFDKWFTDGFHRVRKEFVTYSREDYPPEMATYINRYYRGRLAVGWRGDYLKIRRLQPELARLRHELPPVYF